MQIDASICFRCETCFCRALCRRGGAGRGGRGMRARVFPMGMSVPNFYFFIKYPVIDISHFYPLQS